MKKISLFLILFTVLLLSAKTAHPGVIPVGGKTLAFSAVFAPPSTVRWSFLPDLYVEAENAGLVDAPKASSRHKTPFSTGEESVFAIQPSNDECSGAISLTVGDNFSEYAITTSNAGATNSTTLPAPSCGTFSSTDADVWFSVIAPDEGNLVIETRESSGNEEPLTDTSLQIYTGDCDALQPLACNDFLGDDFYSFVRLTDLSPGENLRVRVWGFHDAEGQFDISAYIPDCIWVTDIQQDSHTDNSIDISWTENGTADSWQVFYGSVGFNPENGEGTMLSIQNTPEATIPANPGQLYEVYVRAYCGSNSVSAFTGPIEIAIPPDNDNICDALQLTVGQPCPDPEAYANVGATSQNGEPLGSCYFAHTFSKSTVWFKFTAPESPFEYSSVRVSTAISGGTLDDTELAIFAAPEDCDNPESMGSEMGCNEDGDGLRAIATADSLIPGDTYYIQVAGYNSAEGTFCIEIYNNSCADPSPVTVSTRTDHSAHIFWNPGSEETTWQLEYGTTGFIPGNGNFLTVSNTPDTVLTGLAANTSYDIYVRALCSDDFSSHQVGPTHFSTLPEGRCGQVQQGNNFENGLTDGTNKEQRIGDDFLVDPATIFTLDSLSINVWTNSDIVINGVTMTFYTDDQGLPGDEIVSLENITPVSQEILGQALGVYDIHKVILQLDDGLEFEGNNEGMTRYWVVFGLHLDDPSENAFLGVTSQNIIGQSGVFTTDNTSFSFFQNPHYDIVMSLIGSCQATESNVCNAPTDLTVTNVSADEAHFHWNDQNNSNPDGWRVQYGEAGFSLGHGDSLLVTVDTDTSLLNLEPDTDYEVYVKTLCGWGENESNWAGPLSFTTLLPPCDPPGSISVDNISPTSAQISWNESDAEAYRIIYGGSGFTPGQAGDSLEVAHSPAILSELSPNTDYAIYIRTLCDTLNGRSSTLSESRSFTTASPSCATPSAIAVENIGLHSAQVNWEGEAEDGYLVIYGSNGFSLGQSGDSLYVDNPPATLSGLDINTAYDVYVVAVCDSLNGIYSNPSAGVSFTTDSPTCDTPTEITVDDIDLHSAQISWEGEAEDGYLVIYGPNGFSLGQSGDSLYVDNPPATLSGLDINTAYDVYVVAVCDSLNGIYSNPSTEVSFTTKDLGLTNRSFKNFAFYPNPTSGDLYLSADKPIEHITLFDLQGRILYDTSPAEKITRLQLGKLKTGIYLMKIKIDHSTKVVKVVKQ